MSSRPGAITPTTTLTGLNNVYGLAFDSAGNLYAANHNANTVSKFGPLTVQAGPPIVSTSGGALIYAANSGAKAIDPALTLTDAESTTIVSATVTISSGYVSGEDLLGFANQNGISGTLIGNKLTLSGTANVAAYQTALASVTYTDTQNDASTANRTISFIVNDGTIASNTATKTVSPQAVATGLSGNATLTGLNGPQENRH